MEYSETFIAFPEDVKRLPGLPPEHLVRVETDGWYTPGEKLEPMVFLHAQYHSEKDVPFEAADDLPPDGPYRYEYEKTYQTIYFGHGKAGLARARRFAAALLEAVELLEKEDGLSR